MKVLVQYFHRPPGRGEFVERRFDMLDANRPKTQAECITRSMSALKRCWPNVFFADAVCYTTAGSDEQYVEGSNWKVQWLPDDWEARGKAMLDAISNLTFDELIAYAEKRKGMVQVTSLREAA